MGRKGCNKSPQNGPAHLAPPGPSAPGLGLLVSFLLGLAGAGTTAGFLGLFRAAFDPLPQTTIIVLAAWLAGLAAGPWLPQGLIRFVSAHLVFPAMRQPGRVRSRTPVALTGDGLESREDRRLLLASACLITALATILMAVLIGPIRALCEWLRVDFFWVPGVLRLADFIVAAAVQFAPASLLGVALVCVLGVCRDRLIGRAGSRQLASVALGLGLGFCAALWWLRLILSSLVILLLSSMPLLVAAVLTLLRASQEPGHKGQRDPRRSPDQAAAPLPELGHAGLGLLLVGLMVWSLSLAVGGVVWYQAGVLLPQASLVPPCGLAALWLACAAAGAWLAAPRSDRAGQALGTSGVRLCLGGLGTAAAIVMLGAGSGGLHPAGGLWGPDRHLFYAAVAVYGLCNGQVLPAILRPALSRFATRGLAHAAIVSAISLAAAAGLLLGGFWLLAAPRALITMSAACLLPVMAGGILVIYDPLEAGRPHQWKLAAVFASLLLLILTLPAAAPRWPLDRMATSGGLPEPAGQITRAVSADPVDPPLDGFMVKSAYPSPPLGPVDNLLAGWARGSKVCIIGDAPTRFSGRGRWDQPRTLQIDHWPHARGRAIFATTGSPLARLRLARQRYDLVILGPVGWGVGPNQDLWTSETFRRLAGLVAPAGRAVVRILPAGLEPADLQTVARTFLKAFNGRAAWLVFGADRAPDAELWLVGRGPGPASSLPLVARAVGASAPKPMKDLLAGSGFSGVHSAEHPRLRADSVPGDSHLDARPATLLLGTDQ